MSLTHCLPHAVSPDAALHLPQLTLLSLTDEVGVCITLYRSLRLSPTVTLHLSLWVDREDSFGEIFTALSENLHPDHCSFTKMEVNITVEDNWQEAGAVNDDDLYHDIHIAAWRDGFPQDGPSHLAVHVRMPGDLPTGPPGAVQRFVHELPIRHGALRNVQVSTEVEWSASDWIDLLGAAHELRELGANAEAAEDLYAILETELAASFDSASSTLPVPCLYWPRLEVLELRDIDLTLIPLFDDFPNQLDCRLDESNEDLLSCLGIRKARGAPIKTIRLHKCDTDSHMEAALGHIVPNVVIET
ncbi:hypothetical protein FA95DRAFT_1607512 [Auriscalpium vulgare]|uniref:Uncharacterized protein n=1 Tax=Auriscalpium vulgare TaxID=40419 RepID=A0ACB8RP14_9AGAM|nr:hypothetical protein FA95DRAFT_1607512 [Auriscalpium vulgare]